MRPAAHEPLRALTDAERQQVATLVRARSERVDVQQRAVALLTVADGQSHEAAARLAGYAHGFTVSRLIQRVNAHGLAALEIAPGRGRKPIYQPSDRQRILDTLLDTLQEAPARVRDQSATWSLTLLQRRLRASGLPQVSRDTIHQTLRQAGYRWQRTRSWCPTGTARRTRKSGVVTVTDPATEQKRVGSSKHTRERKRRG
jgi:Homeodomain-like domain